jgi:hypothetical protein
VCRHLSCREAGPEVSRPAHPISALAQDQVYHPAAANMRPRPAAMIENVHSRAACRFQCISQFRHPLEPRPVIILPGQRDDLRSEPLWLDCRWTEEISDHLAQQDSMKAFLGCSGCSPAGVWRSGPSCLPPILVSKMGACHCDRFRRQSPRCRPRHIAGTPCSPNGILRPQFSGPMVDHRAPLSAT